MLKFKELFNIFDLGLNLVNSPAIRAALVSWGHSNGIVRLKIKKEQPAIPLVYISQLDPVSIRFLT